MINPALMSLIAIEYKALKLEWEPAKAVGEGMYVNGYRVFMKRNKEPWVLLTPKLLRSTSFLFQEYNPAFSYWFRVDAVDNGGNYSTKVVGYNTKGEVDYDFPVDYEPTTPVTPTTP